MYFSCVKDVQSEGVGVSPAPLGTEHEKGYIIKKRRPNPDEETNGIKSFSLT